MASIQRIWRMPVLNSLCGIMKSLPTISLEESGWAWGQVSLFLYINSILLPQCWTTRQSGKLQSVFLLERTLCAKFSRSFQVWAMASVWTGWTPPRRRWPFGRRWCWLPTSGSRGCCRCARWRGGENWNNPRVVPQKCPVCSLGVGNSLLQGEKDHPQGCKAQGDKAVKGQHLGGVNAQHWSTHGGHGRCQTWRNLICLFV